MANINWERNPGRFLHIRFTNICGICLRKGLYLLRPNASIATGIGFHKNFSVFISSMWIQGTQHLCKYISIYMHL